MNEKEKLLKDMAQKYAESYGRELSDEMSRLSSSGEPYPTKNLEKRVMKQVRPQNRARNLRIITATAAALLFIIAGIRILQPVLSETPDSLGESPLEGFEAIALSFAVPEGFTQSGFEQDREKSVYYFEDSLSDDVVLTMEKSAEKPNTAGLTKLHINGSEAYASSGNGYSLLTFNKDGVLYELTCRYDVNTLMYFGNEIL